MKLVKTVASSTGTVVEQLGKGAVDVTKGIRFTAGLYNTAVYAALEEQLAETSVSLDCTREELLARMDAW